METDSINLVKRYPSNITYKWRVEHCAGYIIGGIGFSFASFCYLPGIYNN
jgi:hypothetical protein